MAVAAVLDDIQQCMPSNPSFAIGSRAEVGILTQVYVDVLDEFVSASYGNEVVGLGLLKGFATGFPSGLNSQCMGNERFLDLCDIKQSRMASDALSYLVGAVCRLGEAKPKEKYILACK
eukprot:m.246741 g.246741  ORF g.246741 m.246741 type:complete len:119 (+) comp17153_c0_seq12:3180-3536(+)